MECMELKARIEKTDRKFITIDLFSTKKKKKEREIFQIAFYADSIGTDFDDALYRNVSIYSIGGIVSDIVEYL